MVDHFCNDKLVAVGNTILAALVGFNCWRAFTLEAAFGCFGAPCGSDDAIERADEQPHSQEIDDNVNAAAHCQSE